MTPQSEFGPLHGILTSVDEVKIPHRRFRVKRIWALRRTILVSVGRVAIGNVITTERYLADVFDLIKEEARTVMSGSGS